MAQIGVFGAGYVGLVTAACLAELGNDVVVRDVVPEKIELLKRGEVPIFWTVVDELPNVTGNPVLVLKSTVPVGTGEKVRAALDQRGLEHVGYASNPEFTAEGRALRDFMEPDRIVIGAFDPDD